jgi:hypothetical protein
MALREIVDALDTFIESAGGLNINCIKGFPDFERDNLRPPIAALFYGGSDQATAEAVRKRVGASSEQVVINLGVYAAHEVQLFDLAQRLQAMRRKRPLALTATTGEKIKAYVGPDERPTPDDDTVKEERHYITAPIVLSIEGGS